VRTRRLRRSLGEENRGRYWRVPTNGARCRRVTTNGDGGLLLTHTLRQRDAFEIGVAQHAPQLVDAWSRHAAFRRACRLRPRSGNRAPPRHRGRNDVRTGSRQKTHQRLPELVRRGERREIDLSPCACQEEQQRPWHPRACIARAEGEQAMEEVGVLSRQRWWRVGGPRQVHGAIATNHNQLGGIGRFGPAEAFRHRERESDSLLWREGYALGCELSEGKCLMFLCHASDR
jgi:hypothetical protein